MIVLVFADTARNFGSELSMTRADVLAKFTAIFNDLTDKDVVLRADTTADDVEGWDSVLYVKFIIAIEREFKVRFHPSEINAFADVGGLADCVQRKL